MKAGVLVFPGSNCDHDAQYALEHIVGVPAEFVWHGSHSLQGVDLVIIPGGFSFGDYLRCGAIAKFSPIMAAVKQFAANGGPVLGVCNGFQILTECGLLPGALVRNIELHFVCRTVTLEVVSNQTPFTAGMRVGQQLRLPVAHGEGCYLADEDTLDRLERDGNVVLRYREHLNGSARDIAGLVNENRNVMGMMPHPERAVDPVLGNTDGLLLLRALVDSYTAVLAR